MFTNVTGVMQGARCAEIQDQSIFFVVSVMVWVFLFYKTWIIDIVVLQRAVKKQNMRKIGRYQ